MSMIKENKYKTNRRKKYRINGLNRPHIEMKVIPYSATIV